MELPGKLKSVSINIETGELIVNGSRVHDVTEFCLEFEDGIWKLSLQQKMLYSITGNAASKDAAKE